MQYFHLKQNKNQYTFKIAGQKYADKVFQIVSPKTHDVSCNTTTPAYNARHVGFRMLLFFFPKTKKTP